ncbi:MAG: AAA family ATPase [Candidatus Heimdallarchaeota archaeon]|nr:MAG: AAA family ATPase [Candidatus Heimdallarchaeota archaeon]
MSSPLFDAAKKNAAMAYKLDQGGQAQQAVRYYVSAAEQLQKLINFTDDPNMKNLYYQKAMEYILRVKEIRGIIESSDVKKSSSAAVSPEEDEEISGAISSVIVREKPNVKWEDVAGMEGAKRALREAIILPMSRPDLFKGARKPWKGILMYGPPGCGKTYLCKAVASEVDSTFFSVSAANLISKWLGESEKLVKELYDRAVEESPSIIFFDEIDSLAGARGGSSEGEAMRRVKTQLLQAVEGFGTGEELLVTVGATNTPWDIDAAMRRRFERRVYVTLPTIEAREKMFQIHTRGVELASDVSFEELAKYTAGYTAADIALLCREALMHPIRELDAEGALKDASIQPRAPGIKDFLVGMESIKPSVSPKELTRYEEWKDRFGG